MALRERAIYKPLYGNLPDISKWKNMCKNVKIKLTYLKVRLSLRLLRSLRTIRGRFRRFPVGVVPPLKRSGRPASSLHSHDCSQRTNFSKSSLVAIGGGGGGGGNETP